MVSVFDYLKLCVPYGGLCLLVWYFMRPKPIPAPDPDPFQGWSQKSKRKFQRQVKKAYWKKKRQGLGPGSIKSNGFSKAYPRHLRSAGLYTVGRGPTVQEQRDRTKREQLVHNICELARRVTWLSQPSSPVPRCARHETRAHGGSQACVGCATSNYWQHNCFYTDTVPQTPSIGYPGRSSSCSPSWQKGRRAE